MAKSLAATGRFADPFGYPSGPTAHVGMLTPLPSAFVFWLFGGDSPYAEFVLSCWAGSLVCLSIWLCWRLALVLEAPRAARLAAVAVTALGPLQLRLEMSEDRELGDQSRDSRLDQGPSQAGGERYRRFEAPLACSDRRVDGLPFHLKSGLGRGGDPIRGLVSQAASPVSTIVDRAALYGPRGRVAGRLLG